MIDVKLIRIVTGEEIIAEVLSETDDTITVQNGLVVLPSAQGVGFAPWATVISKDEPEITMSKKHVVYVVACLLYTSPSPRDRQKSRMPSSA